MVHLWPNKASSLARTFVLLNVSSVIDPLSGPATTIAPAVPVLVGCRCDAPTCVTVFWATFVARMAEQCLGPIVWRLDARQNLVDFNAKGFRLLENILPSRDVELKVPRYQVEQQSSVTVR